MIRRLSVKKTAFVLIAFFSLITSFCMIKGNAEENVTSVSETNVVARNSNGNLDEFISVFSFTPISDTECDVRLADKTAIRAIVPEKVELNGKEYTVTVIAANGFTSATKLEMVRLPKSVKTIGSNAFINCKALTTITLPAVETIGANAFSMTKMEYLIIPTTVTSVASTILRGTDTQVYVRAALEDGATTPEGWVSNWNGSNKNQTVEYNSSFVPEVKYEFVSSEIATFAAGDDVDLRTGGYYVTGFQEFCTIDTEDYKEVYIPATYTGEDGVEYPVIGIDEFAFCGTFIDKVTIGYSDLPINLSSNAFLSHEGSLITFNRDITFENENFEGNLATSESVFSCSTVSTIILSKNIETIGNYMFDGCENLRDIHFIEPNGTLSANAEANINLTLPSTRIVKLPNTIQSIGDNAFNLTKNILELHIPNSVVKVGTNIISGWTSDQTVYVDMVADDLILEGWNENWAFGNWNDENAKIVYKVSDKTYNIVYNVSKEYHTNPDNYKSSEGLTLVPAQKEGYTFAGWYLDENFERLIEKIEVGTAGDIVLYAKFIPNEYTIKYEKNQPFIASNQVLGDMNESTHTYGVDSVLNVNKYTLKGWTFIGWNTEADGSGASYADNATVTAFAESGTKKIYAQWEQKTYTIRYNGNRPNNSTSILKGNMVEEIHKYEEEFSLKKVTYTLEGWTFTGWNTKADGTGVTFADEEMVNGLTETEIKLYAQWEVSRYTVVYDKNKPANTDFEVGGIMEPSVHIYDNASFLRTNAYTLEGWTFTGWNTEANGSGKGYSNGAEIETLTSAGSITLYAQWKANTYTIIYNPNRPNSSNQVLGETVESSHTVDLEKQLSPNGYSLVGWTFKGWNTKADGSGTSYINKDSVKNVTTSLSTIELYAQWQAKEFTIEYMSNVPATATNSVQGNMSLSNHLVDTTGFLASNEFTLTGWTFIGWNMEPYGNGTIYANNSSILIATDESVIKLYAQWSAKKFTIEYEINAPDATNQVVGITRNSSHTVDISSPLSTNGYSLTGWTFTGWNTKADGSGTSYPDKSNITIATNESVVKLHAQWEAKEFTIIYEKNKPAKASHEVQGTINTLIYTCDISFSLNSNAYTLEGWTFTGWKTEDGTFYSNDNIIIATDESVVKFYAQWEQNKFTIIYEKNQPIIPVKASHEVQGSMSNSTHTYDTTSFLIPINYTLEGWTFKGWKTENGTSYENSAEVTTAIPSGELTLYAQWEQNKYTIVYLSNGGEGRMDDTSAIYDESVELSENTFSNSGKKFRHWTVMIDGKEETRGDKVYVDNLTSENGGTVYLTAQWQANEYLIRYNSNYPNNNNETITDTTPYAVDETKALKKNTFTFDGYEFDGWLFTPKNGDVQKFSDEKNVSNLSYKDGDTVDLYAQWVPITYKIKFTPNIPTYPIENINPKTIIVEYKYEQVIDLEDIYTLSYWRIDSWTYKDDKGNEITAKVDEELKNLTVINGKEVELTAHWKAKRLKECLRNGKYEIFDSSQLKDISITEIKSYLLLCNLTVENWTSLSDFYGEIDLNGFTITYRKENLSTDSNYGFFLKNHGTIKNGSFEPYIVQSSIDTSQQNEVFIGGVVAENYGTIESIEVLSYIGQDNSFMNSSDTNTDINARSIRSIIGGIAGINYNTIEKCTNYASLGGSYFIGGIVGKNIKESTTEGKIANCNNEGKIWYCSIGGNNKCVGGIVAANYGNAIIIGCVSNGLITFAYRNVNKEDLVYMARIAGWSHTSSTITQCSGLREPIIILVSELTDLQLMYIKSEYKLILGYNLDVGKESSSPDTEHEHSYTYDVDPREKNKWHIGTCSCGYTTSQQAHVIRYVDRNKNTANCIYCDHTLNLKTDLYIVEGGMALASLQENHLSNVSYIIPNNTFNFKKDELDALIQN